MQDKPKAAKNSNLIEGATGQWEVVYPKSADNSIIVKTS